MMMICIDHKVISQDHKTSLFYEPIPLELGWTEIQLPNHVREPYLLNISIGLEVKQDSYVYENEAKIVRDIYEMYTEFNMSIAQIVMKLRNQ